MRSAVVAMVTACATAALFTGQAPRLASASEPTDHLDPARQGSLLDLGNALEASQNDAGLRSDGPPLSVGASTNGCSAAMVKPVSEADVTSPTGIAVTTRYSLQCLLAAGGSGKFTIEYLTSTDGAPQVA